MIEKVEYKENGSIEIHNSELLSGRADMSDEPGEQKLQNEELGGDNRVIEKKLKEDKEKLGWSEPYKGDLAVRHKCPVCGTLFNGRPNKKYCCDRCRKTAEVRRRRKRERDIRDFKPHRGTAGEIYILCEVKGKQVISFIPAFHTENRARAKQYIEDTYPEDVRDNYMEQVKEVLKK